MMKSQTHATKNQTNINKGSENSKMVKETTAMAKTAKEQKMYKKNLRRILEETVLTSIGAGFSVATITLFWNSVGMDQTAIGLVQMIFTIVILFLDIPMGYIADRFNRKLLNIVGDIGVAITFIFYAMAKNIYMVTTAEIVLAIFMAMTNGVDQSFVKYNANQIDATGELFKKVTAKMYTARYIALLIVVLLGGVIAKYNLRLTIALSFVPYFIGGLIAFKIKDFDKKIEVKHSNPVKDLILNVKEVMKVPKLKTYLVSYVLGKEMTHAQIWVFTPLLIMVGVPIEIVGIGWVINQIMQIIGGKISEKMLNLKNSTKFAIPLVIEILWMAVLIINTNIVTVWIFALNGLVHGLTQGTLVTPIQEVTSDEIQTSVLSIASTGARLLYVPLVYFTNYLGNFKLQLALVGVVLFFAPAGLITYRQLRKIEKN